MLKLPPLTAWSEFSGQSAGKGNQAEPGSLPELRDRTGGITQNPEVIIEKINKLMP